MPSAAAHKCDIFECRTVYRDIFDRSLALAPHSKQEAQLSLREPCESAQSKSGTRDRRMLLRKKFHAAKSRSCQGSRFADFTGVENNILLKEHSNTPVPFIQTPLSQASCLSRAGLIRRNPFTDSLTYITATVLMETDWWPGDQIG